VIFPADILHPSPARHFRTYQVFLIHFLKCPIFCLYADMKMDICENLSWCFIYCFSRARCHTIMCSVVSSNSWHIQHWL